MLDILNYSLIKGDFRNLCRAGESWRAGNEGSVGGLERMREVWPVLGSASRYSRFVAVHVIPLV